MTNEQIRKGVELQEKIKALEEHRQSIVLDHNNRDIKFSGLELKITYINNNAHDFFPMTTKKEIVLDVECAGLPVSRELVQLFFDDYKKAISGKIQELQKEFQNL